MLRWTCTACGRILDSDTIQLPIKCGCGVTDCLGESIVTLEGAPPKRESVVRPKQKQKRRSFDCANRGEEIRREPCRTCCGEVLIKVFQCSKHGECTIAKALSGIHVCDGGHFFVAIQKSNPTIRESRNVAKS